MTPLQKLVIDRRAELNLTFREAAQRSGGLVTHDTINSLELGRYNIDGLGPRTRKGLALALDVPSSVVEKAWEASCKATPSEFKLPKKADKLSPKQRKAVLAFVSALLEDEEGK